MGFEGGERSSLSQALKAQMAKGESPWRWQQGFYSFGLNLCIQPFFVQGGGTLPMRRCALHAIVRLRGTECMVDCIFLPRTALAIARLVRGY